MASAEIQAGVCGFQTRVSAVMQGEICELLIESDCPAIQRMAVELTQVEPFQEISYRRKMPLTLQAAVKFCSHSACPVPVGIIKAVEVEAGLALPADVSIKLCK